AGILARESEQPIAIHTKGCRLHGANKVRTELHLVRTLDQAKVVAELVCGGVHQAGCCKSPGAHEIACDIDVRKVGQRYVDALYTDAGWGDNRHLEFRDSVTIQSGMEGV